MLAHHLCAGPAGGVKTAQQVSMGMVSRASEGAEKGHPVRGKQDGGSCSSWFSSSSYRLCTITSSIPPPLR